MHVRVYATLRDLVGASVIDVNIPQRTDVRHVLRQVVALSPQLAGKLWEKDEHLNRSIQVLVNGRSIQFLQGLETPVDPEDNLSMFPPVGGG